MSSIASAAQGKKPGMAGSNDRNQHHSFGLVIVSCVAWRKSVVRMGQIQNDRVAPSIKEFNATQDGRADALVIKRANNGCIAGFQDPGASRPATPAGIGVQIPEGVPMEFSSLFTSAGTGRHPERPVLPAQVPNRTDPKHNSELFRMTQQSVPTWRRMPRSGEAAYRACDRFTHLYAIRSGVVKIIQFCCDGRQHLTGLRFPDNWLGFEGIASGRYECDAIAASEVEICTIPYGAILRASAAEPSLLTVLHQKMTEEIGRHRDLMLALHTLPVDARVADFLSRWQASLAECSLHADPITLFVTRAEIGNHLGMRLESVSRAFSRLEQEGVIRFVDKRRREIRVPDSTALVRLVERCVEPASASLY